MDIWQVDALPVTQSTEGTSKYRCQPVALSHSFFNYHQTLDWSGVSDFMPTLQWQ